MKQFKWFCKWYTLLVMGVLVGFFTFLFNFHVYDGDGLIILYSALLSSVVTVVLGVVNYVVSDTDMPLKEYVKLFWPWLIVSVFASFVAVGISSVCLR